MTTLIISLFTLWGTCSNNNCLLDEQMLENAVTYSIKKELCNHEGDTITVGFTFQNNLISKNVYEFEGKTILIKQNVEDFHGGAKFYDRKGIDIILKELRPKKNNKKMLLMDFIIYDVAGEIKSGYFSLDKEQNCKIVDKWNIELIE